MSSQNVFIRLLSACFSLLLAAVLILAVPLWIINYMLSEDSIDTVSEYIFEDVSDIGFNTTEGSISVARLLLLSIKNCAGAEYITEKQMNEDIVPNFLEAITFDILEDFNDLSEIRISADDVYEFLEDNEDKLTRLAAESGYRYDVRIEENEEIIIDNLKDLLGRRGITLGTVIDEDAAEALEPYLEYAQIALSQNVKVASYGAIAIIGAILFILNLGYFKKFLTSCGTPAVIVGALYFISAIILQALRDMIELPSGGIGSAIHFLFGYTAAVIMDFSAPVFLAGLALLILSLFAGKKHKE